MIRPPGVVAADGSPVEVYRRLPVGGEPSIIEAAIHPAAAILELGCGAGRVTRGLVALGHPVTAVDNEPAMLAELAGMARVEPVLAEIATLDLGRTFPVVVAGSHLLNADGPLAMDVIRTARRDVEPDGIVLAEVYPPEMDWPAAIGRRSTAGPVGITVTRATIQGDRLDAAVAYDLDGGWWEQPFSARLLDDAALATVLVEGGLRFVRWLDRSRGWALARRAEA